MIRPPPSSPLFPYTTLFRSVMTQLETPTTAATRLEFYLVWLALRGVARSEGGVAAPLRHAIALFLDRIDALLDLGIEDRKSTRLNSSHVEISYAVFCLKKKK